MRRSPIRRESEKHAAARRDGERVARDTPATRRAPYLAREREAVMRRSRGVCEVPVCREAATEVHHVFGRRQIVGEPLASSRHFMTDLCKPHHDEAGRHGPLDFTLRWAALGRAVRAYGLDWTLDSGTRDAAGWARAIETEVRRRAGAGAI